MKKQASLRRQEKVFFVDNLIGELKAAKSTVLVNFSGMSVKAQQELKRRLKEVGSRLIIVKNTLFKRAGNAAKIDSKALTDSVLTGQTALVIGDEDPISPVQVLGKFAAEFETLKLKVGIVEGGFYDTDSLVKLSRIPAKEVLLGQVLGILMSPSYGLISTLEGNLQKLIYVLNAKVKS